MKHFTRTDTALWNISDMRKVWGGPWHCIPPAPALLLLAPSPGCRVCTHLLEMCYASEKWCRFPSQDWPQRPCSLPEEQNISTPSAGVKSHWRASVLPNFMWIPSRGTLSCPSLYKSLLEIHRDKAGRSQFSFCGCYLKNPQASIKSLWIILCRNLQDSIENYTSSTSS